MNLQAAGPAATDKALLASLKRLLGRPVALGERVIYGAHGYERTAVIDARVPPGTTREQAAAALKLVETASQPAAPCDLGKALAKLLVKTARRSQGDIDTEAQVSAYIEELRAYPADVALAALAQRRHWFPVWDELARDCDRLVSARRAIARALEVFLAVEAQAVEQPRPTPALRRMPGTAKRAGTVPAFSVSLLLQDANRQRLAQHLDVAPDKLMARLLGASAKQLTELRDIVRTDGADED